MGAAGRLCLGGGGGCTGVCTLCLHHPSAVLGGEACALAVMSCPGEERPGGGLDASAVDRVPELVRGPRASRTSPGSACQSTRPPGNAGQVLWGVQAVGRGGQ